MSLFRIIEGFISTRERNKLPYYAYDGTVTTGTDVLFDFGGLRKDVTIQSNKAILIKFNSAANNALAVDLGVWQFGEQYAEKVYITTTTATKISIMANG
jgi:hypothetical protein